MSGTFLLHNISEALLHFNHPLKFDGLHPLLTDLKYISCVTCGMIWSPTFTSSLETLLLLLTYIPYIMYYLYLGESHAFLKLVSKSSTSTTTKRDFNTIGRNIPPRLVARGNKGYDRMCTLYYHGLVIAVKTQKRVTYNYGCRKQS